MSRDYSKFKENYLDSLDVDNVTGKQIIERMNWIPRTEREPDTGDHVIITVKWSDTDYEVMEDDWGCTVAEMKDGTATPIVQEIYKRMIAWMPMPKPYKGERKDKYVTLHHEDIHFNSEEDEKAFYEALAEIKNTSPFTDEEWEFYKKVNREKMQKTSLNIYDLMNKKEE